MGPMTGRAAGYCAGFGVPGFANPGMGWGRGRGFGGGGRGRGFGYRAGWGYGAPVPPVAQAAPVSEAAAIEAQVQYLSAQLPAMQERLAELKAGKEGKE